MYKAIRAMRIIEDGDLPGIISLIFGYEAKLSKQHFFESLNKPQCNWIYDPASIKNRINKYLEPGALDTFYDEEAEE